jgi:GT2 family glycosyltransferase
MRAEAAKKIGPLDPQFSPAQFEDIDYCYRMREEGWTCLYEPAVEMYHFENVTTKGSERINFPYVTVKNALKFRRKWGERIAREGGPPDHAWAWIPAPPVALEDLPQELEWVE